MNKQFLRSLNLIENKLLSKSLSVNQINHLKTLRLDLLKLTPTQQNNFTLKEFKILSKNNNFNLLETEIQKPLILSYYSKKDLKEEVKDEIDEEFLKLRNFDLIPLIEADLPPIKSHNNNLIELQDKLGVNEFNHPTVAHYKTIVGYTMEEGEQYVYIANWTTKDHQIQPVITNTKLGDEINKNHINNLKQNQTRILKVFNTKFYRDQINFDLTAKDPVFRTKNTWMYGEKGDIKPILVGKTPDGSNQYVSGVLLKYKVQELDPNFLISLKNIPSKALQEQLIIDLKLQSLIYIFNPTTETYEGLNVTQIHLVDPKEITLDLNTLTDCVQLEHAIVLASKQPVLKHYREKSSWGSQQNSFKEKTEFNTLPPIEGPKGPEL